MDVGRQEGGGVILQRIDHVGFAVEDLDSAVDHYERLFGAQVAHRESLESDGVREALLKAGDSYIQLLEPTRADSPVAKFIQRNGGPGMHHVGYGVADVGAALSSLQAKGARLVDEHPRPGSRGCTVAFLHPRGMLGALVELVEDPGPDAAGAPRS